MTDQERLNRIKEADIIEAIKGLYGEGKYSNVIPSAVVDDVKWLISTVEEQQKEIERLKAYSQKSANVALLAELENENARLQQALDFYADEENYDEIFVPGIEEFQREPILDDRGEKARKTLEVKICK